MAKPLNDQLCIVTATTDRVRSRECRWSWEEHASHRLAVYTVENGRDTPYLGTVPAFAEGVRRALAGGHEIIACFHDDLLIEEPGWDDYVLAGFHDRTQMGLAGFLGGMGLGDLDIYEKPYSPMQLARNHVISNERNAEAHGKRWNRAERVRVLDGFCQIGRREFWQGASQRALAAMRPQFVTHDSNLFTEMSAWGLVHHAYDAALGCFAARLGWEVWMLPVACWHKGGQTAVGDPGYSEWAKTIVPGGDQDFWELAHKEVYERFRDVLPLRVR
jgi:hypothetical protein